MTPKTSATILPPLRSLSHDVQSGSIEILNDSSIHISEFYYDGKGTDVHFWVGKGLPSSDGTIIPDEYGSLDPLSIYSGKNITLHLPSNLTINDIDYLAVWSVIYKHNYGHVSTKERLIKTNSTRMFLPLKIKPFNYTNGITSDSVILEYDQKITILNVRFSNTGNNTHFRMGRGVPSSNSTIIPNEYGSVQNLPNYNGQNITLRLPENVNFTNTDYLAVWDNDKERSLGTVYFKDALKPIQDIDIRGVQLGNLTNSSYGISSGPIILVTARSFYITNFRYKATGLNEVYFWTSLKTGASMLVPRAPGMYGPLGNYDGENFYVTLPSNITARDVEKFGIWSSTNQDYFSYIALNSTIPIPEDRPYPDVTDDFKRIIRVQKCCPHNHIVTHKGCVPANVDFNIDMKLHLANDTHMNDDPMVREWIIFAPYVNNIACFKYYLMPGIDNYSLLTTGKLLYISGKEEVPLDRYCLDTILPMDEDTFITTPFVCSFVDSGPETMHIVLAICVSLSAISLFLTAAIYFILRKDYDKRGFSIAAYAVSMGIAFVSLAITQILGIESACPTLGGIFHFFIVSSFVWFVAITYEVYYYIKNFDCDTILINYLNRRKIYFLTSTILPLAIVILTYVLGLPVGLLNPYLDAVCSFSDNQKWMLYIPIIGSILAAVIISTLSCWKFKEYSNSFADDRRRKQVWKKLKSDINGRLRFCTFLVSLTTVCWLSEIITFSLRYPVYVLDVIHSLQGVMVLTTVLSTGGVTRKVVKYFGGSKTSTQNGRAENGTELQRLYEYNNSNQPNNTTT